MYHELAYLHLKRFTPKPVWDLLGIEPHTPFAIVRFVKWDAWHDTQLVGGFTLDQKRELIARLSKHLRVFISSESELPANLEPYRIHIPIERMHDVQAAAALFVGESATMASESVVLGTPAIYIDEVGRGYTDEEARHSLLYMFRPVPNRDSLKPSEPDWISGGIQECIAKAEEIADPSFDSAAYAKRHKAWMATKIDCTAFLTYFIENYPQSVEETQRGGAEFWSKFKRVCQNSESTQNTPKLPVGGDESVFKYSILRDLFLVLTHPHFLRKKDDLFAHVRNKV